MTVRILALGALVFTIACGSRPAPQQNPKLAQPLVECIDSVETMASGFRPVRGSQQVLLVLPGLLAGPLDFSAMAKDLCTRESVSVLTMHSLSEPANVGLAAGEVLRHEEPKQVVLLAQGISALVVEQTVRHLRSEKLPVDGIILMNPLAPLGWADGGFAALSDNTRGFGGFWPKLLREAQDPQRFQQRVSEMVDQVPTGGDTEIDAFIKAHDLRGTEEHASFKHRFDVQIARRTAWRDEFSDDSGGVRFMAWVRHWVQQKTNDLAEPLTGIPVVLFDAGDHWMGSGGLIDVRYRSPLWMSNFWQQRYPDYVRDGITHTGLGRYSLLHDRHALTDLCQRVRELFKREFLF